MADNDNDDDDDDDDREEEEDGNDSAADEVRTDCYHLCSILLEHHTIILGDW
jgi:hypothetical protein